MACAGMTLSELHVACTHHPQSRRPALQRGLRVQMQFAGCTWQYLQSSQTVRRANRTSIQPQSLPLEAWRRAALLRRLLLQRPPHFRVRLLQQALLLQAVLCCARSIHAPLVRHRCRTLLQRGP